MEDENNITAVATFDIETSCQVCEESIWAPRLADNVDWLWHADGRVVYCDAANRGNVESGFEVLASFFEVPLE